MGDKWVVFLDWGTPKNPNPFHLRGSNRNPKKPRIQTTNRPLVEEHLTFKGCRTNSINQGINKVTKKSTSLQPTSLPERIPRIHQGEWSAKRRVSWDEEVEVEIFDWTEAAMQGPRGSWGFFWMIGFDSRPYRREPMVNNPEKNRWLLMKRLKIGVSQKESHLPNIQFQGLSYLVWRRVIWWNVYRIHYDNNMGLAWFSHGSHLCQIQTLQPLKFHPCLHPFTMNEMICSISRDTFRWDVMKKVMKASLD